MQIIICIDLHVMNLSKYWGAFMNSNNSNNVLPQKFVIIDGYKIKYLDYSCRIKRFSNTYQILVLLHGIGASCERWLKVAQILSRYFRIIISQVSYLMSSYHLPNLLSRYSDTLSFSSSM